MRQTQALPQWQGGDARAFRHWLRTGLVVIDDEEQIGVKYNHIRDELGRFAFAPRGPSSARAQQPRPTSPAAHTAPTLNNGLTLRPSGNGVTSLRVVASPEITIMAATGIPPATIYPAPVRARSLDRRRALPYDSIVRLATAVNRSGFDKNIVIAQIYAETR